MNREALKAEIREALAELIAEEQLKAQEQHQQAPNSIPGSQLISKTGNVLGATVGGVLDLAAGILSMTAQTLTGVSNTIRTPQPQQKTTDA